MSLRRFREHVSAAGNLAVRGHPQLVSRAVPSGTAVRVRH
jgi:hypothetical protein